MKNAYLNKNGKNPYGDIMDLPYIKSVRHPHMRMSDRAAQFAAFAALTGHGKVIQDAIREHNKV